MRLQTSIVIGALTLCSAIACGQSAATEVPRYDLTVRLKPTAPRVAGEAIVTVPAPDTGHVSFVLGEMFNVESVDLRVNNEFRRSRTDTAYLQGLRREWGYIRWRLLDDDPDNARHFAGGQGDRAMFDLPGYCLARLRAAGVGVAAWTGHCTYSDPRRFFSYRRACHMGEPDYGRLVAAITL